MNPDLTTTTDDLILYLYEEQTPLEKAITEAELEWHEELQEEYSEYRDIKKELDNEMRSPSDTSVQIVRNYAHQSKVENSL